MDAAIARGRDPRGRVPPHVRGGRGPVRASAARRRRDARDQLERALPHRSRPPGAGRPRRDADPRSRPGDGAGGGRGVAGDPHHRGRAPLALGVRDRDRPRRGRRRGQPVPRRRVDRIRTRRSQQIRASPRSSIPTGTPPSWARPSATQRSLARSRRWPPKAPPRSTAAPSGMRTSPGSRPPGRRSAIDDLARHDASVLAALRSPYRDWHVSVVPPNSQGFVLLQILVAARAPRDRARPRRCERRPDRAGDRGSQQGP